MQSEREKERKSTGIGTLNNPFTYNSEAENPTKHEIIREAAKSEAQKAAKGTPIYFQFETGMFYIQRHSASEPIFEATLINKTEDGDKRKVSNKGLTHPDNITWTSKACSLFTLEVMKLELRKLLGD